MGSNRLKKGEKMPEIMQKKPLQSKKWIAMLCGIIGVIIVFITSAVLIIICKADPQTADQIISLAETVIMFLGSVVSILITGQSAVDWQSVKQKDNNQKL